jgi:hypothetical protein
MKWGFLQLTGTIFITERWQMADGSSLSEGVKGERKSLLYYIIYILYI